MAWSAGRDWPGQRSCEIQGAGRADQNWSVGERGREIPHSVRNDYVWRSSEDRRRRHDAGGDRGDGGYKEGFFDCVPTCPRNADRGSRSVGASLRMTSVSKAKRRRAAALQRVGRVNEKLFSTRE